MDAPVQDPQDESIGELVTRLVDAGRGYARAEIDLYREIARHRAGRAKTGAAMLVAGGVLLLFGIGALVIGLVLGLAIWIGPLAAGAAVAAALVALGLLLARSGAKGLRALAGDAEEQAALTRGETIR